LVDFVPPVTGIHLAALTPADHEVELIHEQLRAVPVDREVDLVALSFFSGFARGAYDLADRYRALGITVVAGGPHASYWVEEALQHVDAVVTGEAEEAWPRLLRDFQSGSLDPVYRGAPASMLGLPTPRYDLLERAFVVPRVMQATRGCPFSCSFCSVPSFNPGFRVRPINDVVRDIEESKFLFWWQNKVVWFWDDNLLVRRVWAKELLRELAGLKRWWLTQASIDIVYDKELLISWKSLGASGSSSASRVSMTQTCAVSGNTRITPANTRRRFQDCMIGGSALWPDSFLASMISAPTRYLPLPTV
jgi:radical SAM superfamily enzyme YgiQ (UPF0313 family)